ncbi:MAG: regulatory protein MarR [Gemmatimonadetes bacterium]|nr:regulatory protein MarR [Gemmatimonadota bacterium]
MKGNRTPAEQRVLKLWVVLSRAFNAVARHTNDDIGRHDLTPTEFAVLEALYHKGPMLLGEVQRSILITSGGVTYVIDRLETRGLLERRLCPGDRRARYAALTPAGEALVAEIFPAHIERITAALGGLDAGEQAEAIRLLRTLGRSAAERFEPAPAAAD